MRILTDSQEQLLQQERRALNDLRVLLARFPAEGSDEKTLVDAIQQLDELFLLVVVGEFNSGKSAFINALLGQKLLKEGVTPTTAEINILHYGETQERALRSDGCLILKLPAEILKEISLVDTPGTNAVIREHETLTNQFVPRSDLVLFITSADRPFTESERAFLEQIRDWGKKVVIVINKIDIIEQAEEMEQVTAFVADNARRLLGADPQIFTVSARAALRAKLGEPALWAQSQFEPLETYIRTTLDETARLKLKFTSPLGVGNRLTEKYLGIAGSRLDLLKTDVEMLADVDRSLAVYQEDMQRDFQFRMADIENVLLEMEKRGDHFFDETFRLARVMDLLDRERIKGEFERNVVADVPHQIDEKVNRMIDWLVDADLHQWQAVEEHLRDQRRKHQARIVGDATIGTFHYDRERLIDAVGREAARVVETFDKSKEAHAIAEGAQAAVAASAALEVGAIGLGALITALASTVAVDVTGVVLASLVAVMGLFIIPARRRQAKSEMSQKVSALRDQLTSALRGRFEREIELGVQRIQEAMAPYTRFVRAERESLSGYETSLTELHTELEAVRLAVEEF